MNSQFFKNLRLSPKLNLIIALVLIPFLVSIALILNNILSGLTKQTSRQRVQEEVEVIRAHFAEIERELLSEVKLTATRPGLIEAMSSGDRAATQSHLLIGAAPFAFDEIDLIDSQNDLIETGLEVGELIDEGETDLLKLALLGIETTGLTMEKDETMLRLSGTAPIKDSSGQIIGGLLASKTLDKDFLAELNFFREDVHLVLIHETQPVAQHVVHSDLDASAETIIDTATVTTLFSDLIDQTALTQARQRQTVITDDFIYLNVDNSAHRVAYTPLIVSGETEAVMIILFNLEDLIAFQNQVTRGLTLIFALLTVIAMGALALVVRRGISLPLAQLSAAAEQMTAGRLTTRVDIESNDEIGSLAASFNQMAHQLQTSFTELTDLNAEMSRHRDHLEGLVAERAADLAKTNEQLQREIAGHQQTEEVLRQTNTSLQQRLTELAVLNRINQTLTAALDFRQMLETVAKELVSLFDADTSGVGLLNEAHTELRIVAEYTRLSDTSSAVGLVFPLTDNPFTIQVIEEHRPKMLRSADINPVTLDTSEILNERQVQCIMILPLLARGQVIGTIGVDTTQPGREFTPADLALAETIAGQIAGAIELGRLFETEQRQRQVAESLREVSIALNSSLNRGAVLNIIFEQLEKVIQYDGGGLFLQDGDELELVNGWNVSRQFIGRRLQLSDQNIGVEPLKRKEVTIIEDVHRHPGWLAWPGDENIRAWMGAPLITPKKTIGLLTLDNFTANAYSTDDARTFQLFANQAALALQNAQLYTAARQEIVERKQAQIALAQARDAALAASRFKSELLAKVSHELRTPLNAVLGYAEMLQMGIYGPLSEKQQQSLTEIVESGEYLTHIIDELLDQALIESGKITLESRSFAPSDLIHPIKEPMQMLAQAKGLTFTTDIADDLPPLLTGDPTRLRQILTNLVANAIKFTETGSVSVRLYQADASQWAICVSDTGPGIPLEAQARVFEPFGQVDGSMTRQHGGTGLGLSIAKQLTEVMGGQIILDSKVGQGSTFIVWLPLSQSEETISV